MLNGARRIVTVVPSRSFSDRPSTAMRKLCDRLSTLISTVTLSLTTIGRMFSECGATGVRHRTSVDGTMIGPPFDSE